MPALTASSNSTPKLPAASTNPVEPALEAPPPSTRLRPGWKPTSLPVVMLIGRPEATSRRFTERSSPRGRSRASCRACRPARNRGRRRRLRGLQRVAPLLLVQAAGVVGVGDLLELAAPRCSSGSGARAAARAGACRCAGRRQCAGAAAPSRRPAAPLCAPDPTSGGGPARAGRAIARRTASGSRAPQPGPDLVPVLVEARRAPRDRRALSVEATGGVGSGMPSASATAWRPSSSASAQASATSLIGPTGTFASRRRVTQWSAGRSRNAACSRSASAATSATRAAFVAKRSSPAARSRRPPRTAARTGGRCRPRRRSGGRPPRRSRTARCSGGGCPAGAAAPAASTQPVPWLSSEVERGVHQRHLDVAAARRSARARPARPGSRPWPAGRTRGRRPRRRPSAGARPPRR